MVLLVEELNDTLNVVENLVVDLRNARSLKIDILDINRREYYIWVRASTAWSNYIGFTRLYGRSEKKETVLIRRIMISAISELSNGGKYSYKSLLLKKFGNLEDHLKKLPL